MRLTMESLGLRSRRVAREIDQSRGRAFVDGWIRPVGGCEIGVLTVQDCVIGGGGHGPSRPRRCTTRGSRGLPSEPENLRCVLELFGESSPVSVELFEFFECSPIPVGSRCGGGNLIEVTARAGGSDTRCVPPGTNKFPPTFGSNMRGVATRLAIHAAGAVNALRLDVGVLTGSAPGVSRIGLGNTAETTHRTLRNGWEERRSGVVLGDKVGVDTAIEESIEECSLARATVKTSLY